MNTNGKQSSCTNILRGTREEVLYHLVSDRNIDPKPNKKEWKLWNQIRLKWKFEREREKNWLRKKKGAYVTINTWYSVGGNPTSSGRCKEDYGFGRFWKH